MLVSSSFIHRAINSSIASLKPLGDQLWYWIGMRLLSKPNVACRDTQNWWFVSVFSTFGCQNSMVKELAGGQGPLVAGAPHGTAGTMVNPAPQWTVKLDAKLRRPPSPSLSFSPALQICAPSLSSRDRSFWPDRSWPEEKERLKSLLTGYTCGSLRLRYITSWLTTLTNNALYFSTLRISASSTANPIYLSWKNDMNNRPKYYDVRYWVVALINALTTFNVHCATEV